MAKYYGVIGYAESEQTEPGVWEDVITEKNHFGDVLRNTRQLATGDKINNDLTVGNLISVIADPWTHEHIFAMKYLVWLGTRWLISNVDVQYPRLVFTLGGVYNGPGPTSVDPDEP